MFWKTILSVASEIVEVLPPEEAGKCVLGKNGELYNFSTIEELRGSIDSNLLEFRTGCIGGVLPNVLKTS